MVPCLYVLSGQFFEQTYGIICVLLHCCCCVKPEPHSNSQGHCRWQWTPENFFRFSSPTCCCYCCSTTSDRPWQCTQHTNSYTRPELIQIHNSTFHSIDPRAPSPPPTSTCPRGCGSRHRPQTTTRRHNLRNCPLNLHPDAANHYHHVRNQQLLTLSRIAI